MSIIFPCPTCHRLMTDSVCSNCIPLQPTPAPMSRREEVNAEIGEWASDGDGTVQMACLRTRCRTLADEVDYLRATRADRDAVIDKLLAMLFDEIPKSIKPNLEGCTSLVGAENRYNRALVIAGRKK